MLKLEVSDLQWIRGPEDDPSDQCAHGRVAFAIDEIEFVRPGDGIWTVSAAALFLLRTLDADRVPSSENQLFPCCGFSVMTKDSFEQEILVFGCPSGIDASVTCDGERLTIRVGDRSATTSRHEWREAVVRFADDVRSFYERSRKKFMPASDEERRGWSAFWREFDQRHRRARDAQPR